jgi:winged helix DNA-binding protein
LSRRRSDAGSPGIGDDVRVPRSRHQILSADQLNRATLARQLLLDRATIRPTDAVERVGGLQGQEPASPYIALWSRLEAFGAGTLDRAFMEHRLVKATLMRSTLHVVSRDDYLKLLPATQPMLRGLNRRGLGADPGEARVRELTAAALAFADQPRSNTAIRDHVAGLAGDMSPDDALWFVRRYGEWIHVPSAVPWSFTRRPVLTAARAWLGDPPFAEEPAALEQLARRYLGAFGPATAKDMAAWSGLPIATLRPALAAIDAGGELVRYADERGLELLDLAGIPQPPADIDAPVRFLPMWDSLLLAYADRTRVIGDTHRRVVVSRNGDTLPTFLVNGRVAGLWWAEADGPSSRIVVEPFVTFSRLVRREVEREGERLAEFVGPIEPDVYRRYRTSRARASVPAIPRRVSSAARPSRSSTPT